MRVRRLVLFIAVICVASAWLNWRQAVPASAARAQQQPAGDTGGPGVIRVESRLVLVDSVVTDKKGDYIRDLTAKEFKVWEDNKEQAITSFSFEEDSASPAKNQKRYMVLFFDNSTMDMGDQVRARKAASQFIDANAGPNRLIAIIDFGGSVHIAQNFTADPERLKQVVAGVKGSSVSPNAQTVEVASLGTPPIPSLSNAEADFGAHTVMLALRSLAKDLTGVPGRKSLVMLTSGFPLTPDRQSELTAVIDACNKANVAVYPIDVRGLVVPGDLTGPPHSFLAPSPNSGSARVLPAALRYNGNSVPGYPFLRFASFVTASADPQHTGGGGGGGGGGGHGGGSGPPTGGGGGTGGSGGGHGGTGGTGGGGGRGSSGSPTTYGTTPYNQPRQIVPPFPESASTNQQVLYQLADGTGGFVIVNTNDLLG